jgi:hypothetical protein
MTWRSAVIGEKLVPVMYKSDAKARNKVGRPVFIQNSYWLTFHCASAK